MPARTRGERGLSLIEVLVATAVLSVTVIVALMVYDASRKAFAKSENATEEQETVRIAFDKLTTDLRMLGYNVNPDGNPNRPDEQLEGALDHAVIFRADFDRSEPGANVTPETALAGGAFSSVSTGNDEIVAYVLSKPDGTGPDAVTFQADVRESPRDGAVEPVTIDNVVLDPTSPPYTLYRVTFNNDPATYGSPAFVVRTPVAENVRDLRFTYYDGTSTFNDASASIPETAAAKAARAGLTHVNVSLVGMTRQPDLAYNDPGDPAAPGYRKFELRGDVTPRNMRMQGIQDLNADVTPPSKPAMPALVRGHCGGLLATWAPNPTSDGVVQYRVRWVQASSGKKGSRNVPGSPYFVDGLTMGATCQVWIQAQDAQGNPSLESDPASDTVTNVNTPVAPTGLTTSTDQKYRVVVSWIPVTTNTANDPSADPLAPKIRDLAGYRLYWHFAPPNLSDRDEWNPVAGENVIGRSSPNPYLDTPLVACLDRYYWMTAVDTCGVESGPSSVSKGRAANSGVKPSPPQNVQAHYVSTGTAAQVKWSQIAQDVAGQGIKIERYEVFRSHPIDGLSPPSSAVWDAAPLGVVYINDYDDTALPSMAPGQVVYYRVRGGDYCDNDSDMSAEAKLECAFTGDVDFQTPADGSVVSGAVPVTVTLAHPSGADMYALTSIVYVQGGSVVRKFTASPAAGTQWTDSGWTAVPAGAYTITATVQNAAGCTETGTIYVTATNAPPPTAP